MRPLITITAGFLCLAAHAAGNVDDARLKNADTDRANWLTHGRDYAQQRFSPLTQIDVGNVKRLVPKWIYQTGVAATFQATPIVVDGVMYVSMPFNHVAAIDARSGRELWRYEHKRKTLKMCCGPANRGVAVGYGKVYVATVDARLIALDQANGKVVWDIDLVTEGAAGENKEALAADDPLKRLNVTGATGVGAAVAPLVYDGKIYVGITGVGYGLHLDSAQPNAPLGAVVGVSGRFGRPGFVAAFDAQSGRRLWQFDTTKSGWEGEYRATTPDGVALHRDITAEKMRAAQHAEAWRYGGGSFWNAPAVDPQLGLIYFGIGNPSPQMDDEGRPGDNLYTSSLAAVHARTGELAWYYQQVPHDLWGYDVASPPVLFDVEHEGKRVPAVGQASKLGWFYVHDRRTGALLFKSEAFVPQENLFAPPSKAGARIAPAAAGGANWSPVAYSAQDGVAYVAAMHMPMRYTIHEVPGAAGTPPLRYFSFEPTSEPTWGTLTAIDVRHRGRITWQHKTPEPLIGGVLATAGGLVFTGEGNGYLSAFDAKDGKPLWQFQCGAGVNAPPIAFEVDGKQYIAVAAGGSQIWGYRQGGAVIVFGLMD